MGCLTFVALIVGFVALLIVVVFGAMKSTDVYKEAVSAGEEQRGGGGSARHAAEGGMVSLRQYRT